MTNGTFAVKEQYDDVQTALRFLAILDNEQVDTVTLTVTAKPSNPFTDGDVTTTATAPPSQEGRPAGDSGNSQNQNDERSEESNGEPQKPSESDTDSDDSDADSPDRGDGADGGSGNSRSDGSSNDSKESRTPPSVMHNRTAGEKQDFDDDSFVPRAKHYNKDCYMYLRPGHAYHHTLYLLAAYQHETGEKPTSKELFEYFEDCYDTENQASSALSAADVKFDVANHTRENFENGRRFRYWINERGIRYLEEHGYPETGDYEIPREHRYEIERVTEDDE